MSVSDTPEKRGRGNKRTDTGEFSGVSQQRVSDARAVLAHSSELAQAVMRGEKMLVRIAESKRLRPHVGVLPADTLSGGISLLGLRLSPRFDSAGRCGCVRAFPALAGR